MRIMTRMLRPYDCFINRYSVVNDQSEVGSLHGVDAYNVEVIATDALGTAQNSPS
jgi:hypothetical protein